MFERILVPTDGSDVVTPVLDGALDIAERHDATVYLLNVADTTQLSLTTTEAGVVDVLEQEGNDVVEAAARRVRERDVDVVTAVRQGRPAATIVEYATTEDVDLVVMPTHGRTGVARLVLGSVTERVVRTSEIPVLTVRPEATLRFPFERVLVPVDGSDVAENAIQAGIGVARTYDAALDLLNVVDTASIGPDIGSYIDVDRLEARSRTILEDAVDTATEAGLDRVEHAVEYGSPNDQITRYVEDHDVDLVVMGTHGLTGLDRYLLGSTTEKVLRTAPVPVMTVHGLDED